MKQEHLLELFRIMSNRVRLAEFSLVEHQIIRFASDKKMSAIYN